MRFYQHRVKAFLWAIGFGALFALMAAHRPDLVQSTVGRCLVSGIGAGLCGTVIGVTVTEDAMKRGSAEE